MTLYDLDRRFPDEDTARAHLFRLRWPDGKVTCPRCGKAEKVYRRAAKDDDAVSYRWICKTPESCKGYGFSLTTATIFEDTKIPLRDWFRVLLLMLSAKKGMSALQIQRTVFGQVKRTKGKAKGKVAGKGSYETTWYMCHRLRAAMKDSTFRALTGVVEVDETYVGGKAENRHGGQAPSWRRRKDKRPHFMGTKSSKSPVIGAIARKGNVVAQVIDRVTARTMHGFVNEVIADDVELIATDDHPGYRGLNRQGYPHESVAHSQGEYVRGVVHTANLDSFWSLLKRGVMGTYHKVSWSYLPLYLNEFSYRHNRRGELNADTFDRVLEAC
jgi:transposase-like protein